MFEGIQDKEFARYKIYVINGNELNEYSKILKNKKFIKENNEWTLIVE